MKHLDANLLEPELPALDNDQSPSMRRTNINKYPRVQKEGDADELDNPGETTPPTADEIAAMSPGQGNDAPAEPQPGTEAPVVEQKKRDHPRRKGRAESTVKAPRVARDLGDGDEEF